MSAGKTWTRQVSKSNGYLVLSNPVNPQGRNDPAGEITIQKGDVGTTGAKIIYTKDNTFDWDGSSPVVWKDNSSPATSDITASVSGATLTITDNDTDAGDTSYSYYLKASDGTETEDPTIHNRS